MITDFLFKPLEDSSGFRQILSSLQTKGNAVYLTNLGNAAKAFYTAGLAKRTDRPFLILCESERAASAFYDDLAELLQEPVLLFPARELTFYQDVASSRELTNRRLAALYGALFSKSRIVLASADTLLHRLMPKEVFRENTIRICAGDQVEMEEVCSNLIRAGYTREDMVEGKGQFAARGEVLDIYPVHETEAIRIDFFDNEVDSIRAFDLQSQRSGRDLTEVVIPPACEAVLPA